MPPRKSSNHIGKKRERTLFFFGVLFTTFLATVYLLHNYISVVLLAFIFSIIVHPLYAFMKKELRMNNAIASITTIIISFFVVILPLILAMNMFIQEVSQLSNDSAFDSRLIQEAVSNLTRILNSWARMIPVVNIQFSPSYIDSAILRAGENISSYLLNNIVKFGTSSFHFLANFFIFLILTYFTIPSLPTIKKYILSVSPLDDAIDKMYIERATTLIVSMIKSIFVVALAQGLLGGLFLWIAGVEYVLTLTIAMVILSVIPMVGTGFITVPVALYLFLQGNITGGLIILAGQVVFIVSIDDILRAGLLSRDTSLHPAVMLLSIIGGISIFGFLGIIYGPLIMIFFLTSLEIYTKHYKY